MSYMELIYIVSFSLPFLLLLLLAIKHLTSSSLGEYFLVDKKVDREGFYKNSIGYSLQVGAIFLFFYWGYTYGLKAFIVPFCWIISLFIMAKLIDSGRYNEFFDDTKRTSPTLHGFLKEKLVNGNGLWGTLTVLQVTLATIVAIGSFLLFEVDYASKYLFQSIQFVPSNIQEYLINTGIILFITVLVALGGFKVAVETDKKLTPLAYIGFSVFFAFLLSFTFMHSVSVSLVASLLLAISGAALLFTRSKAYKISKASLLSYGVTFAVSTVILFLSLINLSGFDSEAVKNVFWPHNDFFMGFGLIGIISLILGNGTYLLSEVVMLQRNQSFFDGIDTKTKTEVLRITGIEMGIGWFIVLVVGTLLRSVTPDGNIIAYIMQSPFQIIIMCIFLFSASVFMLSTVNGLVSSLGYVAYFDIINAFKKEVTHDDNRKQLFYARITSFIIVLGLYGLYILTKQAIGKDKLALILTSMYGFQCVLTGPALLILFTKRKASKLALAIATFVAFYISYYSAFGVPLSFIPADSWYVISQGAVILGGFTTYLIINYFMRIILKP